MRDIVRGAVDGREVLQDFGGFYARTYPMAYRTALGICREAAIAEEATQDAYVSAFRDRDRYRGDGHPDAWLLRIVVNSALTVLRRRSVRRATALPDEADGSTADSPRLPDPVESMAIRQALDALDGRHRPPHSERGDVCPAPGASRAAARHLRPRLRPR